LLLKPTGNRWTTLNDHPQLVALFLLIIYGDWYIWNFVLMEKSKTGRMKTHRNAITINDFSKKKIFAMIFVRYFKDSWVEKGKNVSILKRILKFLSALNGKNWDFLKRKNFFFHFDNRRKSANSERNLYCNKRRGEKYLTRFEVDIASNKKGKNPNEKAKNFLHWNVYLDEICLHSSFHIALNKLIPCFFPACRFRFTLIELFFGERVE
jgi:hypothetical protein